MLHRLAVIAACVAVLALSALPASAATGRIHLFSIPGVYGVSAWGSYDATGKGVRVTVCVKDTARDVYGAAAAGVAFDSGYHHHNNVGAATIGYNHTQCRVMTTGYTAHLIVEALSGNKNGTVRQHGKLRQIY